MPTATVRLPGVLRAAVGDLRAVEVSGDTVRDALEDLCRQHPTLRVRLFDGQGAWRPHVLCVLHDQPIRPDGSHVLHGGEEIVVMPAVSGG